MARLDDLWARFSLMEEEKGGAKVSKQEASLFSRQIFYEESPERGCSGSNIQTAVELGWQTKD